MEIKTLKTRSSDIVILIVKRTSRGILMLFGESNVISQIMGYQQENNIQV